MKFSILSSLLFLSWQSSTILAAPLDSGINTLNARANKIPTLDQVDDLIADPSKFADWAQAEQPVKDKAIFFTGQSGQNINKIVTWANNNGLTSVRNIWNDANFFRKGQYPGISDDKWKNFQKAFSTYYADQTKGTAWLVFPQDQTPSSTGIFYSVELTEIIAKAKVDKIVWIDQTKALSGEDYDWMNEQKVYWTKGEGKPSA
jgi:hypothetical protein